MVVEATAGKFFVQTGKAPGAGEGRPMTAPDLFGHVNVPPMLVRLERSIDHDKPCCGNVAVVHVRSTGVHAAELRCAGCDRHRGWLPKRAFDFLTTTAQRFGAPAEPIILRDFTIGDHTMTK